MLILGISAYYHDSAAALLKDGQIIAAAQEERFTRIKHDESFPNLAIAYCLKEAGISMDQVDAVAFYDKPLLKFERLLDTYLAFAPKGMLSFITAMPVWIKEKLFLKKAIRDELKRLGSTKGSKLKIWFPEHHLSHAASCFFSSPFEESAILTIDGVGEWATASIGKGKGNSIALLKELHFPNSLGLLYSAFTYFLGFKVNSGEYKLMGLAPFGNPDEAQVKAYVSIIKSKLVDIKEDGSIWLNQAYFNYATGLRMVSDKQWEALFGMPKREPDDPLLQAHCDLGQAIQQITEEVVLKMALHAKEITQCDRVCMAGGVALNAVSNGKLVQKGIFSEVFIQPASGDAGGALGAAQAVYYIGLQMERNPETEKMKDCYLGPAYTEEEAKATLDGYKAPYFLFSDDSELAAKVADLILQGQVVGWFQDRMEFGPRALGNRSILANPQDEKTQQRLNLKIKFREGFRPFAPVVKAENASKYFDMKAPSPFMLRVFPLLEKWRQELPSDFSSKSIQEKLEVPRSTFPAITHVDFSARVQTVTKEGLPKFWMLLDELEKKSGYDMVVNTSFNVRGEPPVCSPEDAYRCFMETEMDFLVIGKLLLEKNKQPVWKQAKKAFTLD